MLAFDARRSVISFGIVKAVLAQLGLDPAECDAQVARALRLIFPLDVDLAARVRGATTSLTDSATPSEQIRFFQQQRADRAFVTIARWITDERGPIEIVIGSVSELDRPSRDFFRLATATAGWRVTYTDGLTGAAEEPIPPAEAALEGAIARLPDRAAAEELWRRAFDYVNAGDAWTAHEVGRRLVETDRSVRVWNLLALASAMLGRTIEADFYYDRWIADAEGLDRVRACYGKAMLYARHHPVGLRDLEVSGRLLREAHTIIERLPPSVRADDTTVFEEVFNRNGYALVEFRRGNVSAALSLLEDGIARLTMTGEKVAIHRSVLIYNLAQCFASQGRLDRAIETYEALLDVDPHMPEYWLEAAKCLAARGQTERAIAFCRRALRLDDALATAWSLLGKYLSDTDAFGDAADAFDRAALMDPRSAPYRLDAAFCLLMDGRPLDARDRLAGVRPSSLPEHELVRHASLLAEIHLRDGDPSSAAIVLERALERAPGSAQLRANLEVVAR